MRIVQLVMARQFRGAEVFAAQLSRELVSLGEEVHYVSLYAPEGKEFMPEGISCEDLGAKITGRFNLGLIIKLNRFLRTYQPDIVQANAGDTLKYAVLVKWLFGHSYKIVFRNASTVSQYLKTYPQKLLASFLFRQTGQIISVSEKCKSDLVTLFPSCGSKIEVIPIGITPRPFTKLKEFSNGKVNLVHVGGFTFEKNHSGLIRIFNSLKNKMPNAMLWLVGDGPLQSKIKAEVQHYSLSDSVFFTGAVTNPWDYIHSSKLLLLPSHIEGLPGVILESFFCRVPVVAYQVGGVGDVIEQGHTGWLIEKDDEEAFVKKTIEVLADEDQTKSMVEESFRLVVDRFDNQSIAKRFLRAYQHLNKKK